MTENSDRDILLVYPFLEEASWKNQLRLRESLALGYLSAFLRRKGFVVDTINAELEELSADGLLRRVASSRANYSFIGVSCTSQRTYLSSKDVIKGLRSIYPDVHITMGGVFSTLAHLEALEDIPELDSVIRGEGEYTLLEVAQKIQARDSLRSVRGISYRDDGHIKINPSRERIMDLDNLPFPSRDELSWVIESGQAGSYAARLIASRGCYGHCTFCSIHSFYGNGLRVVRSPRNVVDEIEQLVRSWGIKRFNFQDDVFVDRSRKSTRWAHQLCDEILSRQLQISFSVEVRATDVTYDTFSRLKEAGLRCVYMGVESGVQRMLNRYGKETTVQENDRGIAILEKIGGITIRLGYIMFDPDLTLEELRDNYLWLRSCPYAMKSNFHNRLNAYYGTPIAETLSQEGRLTEVIFSERWNYTFKDDRVQRLWEIIEHYKNEVLSDITRKINQLVLLIKKELNYPYKPSQPYALMEMRKAFELEELKIWTFIFDEAFSLCSSSVSERHRLAKLQADVEQRIVRLEEMLDNAITTLAA